MRRLPRCGPAVLAAALLLACGCGPRGPALVPVECRVVRNGTPLEQIEVKFLCEPGKDQPEGLDSFGISDANGVAEMVASDGRKGVTAGRHRVVLRDLKSFGSKFIGRRGDDTDDNPAPKGPPSRVPLTHADPAKTPLSFEIAEGQATPLLIEVGKGP